MSIPERANIIYENTRTLLINTEPIAKEISRITHPQLREELQQIFRTCQADILILNDFLIEIINCETEEEINYLLENNYELIGKVN